VAVGAVFCTHGHEKQKRVHIFTGYADNPSINKAFRKSAAENAFIYHGEINE
jgi:hypothetical protein